MKENELDALRKQNAELLLVLRAVKEWDISGWTERGFALPTELRANIQALTDGGSTATDGAAVRPLTKIKTWEQMAWEEGCDPNMRPDPKHYTDEMLEEIRSLRAAIDNNTAVEKVPASNAVGLPRKPTESMLNAARDWSVKKYGIGVGNSDATGCWQAMFDAANAAAAIGEQMEKQA